MKTNIVFICLSILALISCKDEIENLSNLKETEPTEIIENHLIFSKILAKAVEDKDIRNFIKQQAQLQIDKDYDVIYHYTKDLTMNNGKTFRENLSFYCEDGGIDYLDKITSSDMALTIFVPHNKDAFSIKNWDTEKEIPIVAYRDEQSDKLPAYNLQGETLPLDRYTKPQEAVLVVKSNERLTTNTTTRLNKTETNSISNKDGIFSYFIDSEFNNIKRNATSTSKKTTKATSTPYQPEVFINFDAKDKSYISTLSKVACPRDYIYYGISDVLGINEGTLDKEYREFITFIEFNNYNSLSHINDLENQAPDADWSDGNLEIVFDFVFITKDAAISTIKKMISVDIDKLFDAETENTKKYYLPNPIEVFNWDLEKFGDTYKIEVSEYDSGTQSQYTSSISSVYGSNFKSEASGSLFGLIKVGANYSYSETKTKQATTVITSTNNSDPLGGVFINFFDPIYTNNKVMISWNAYDYDYGICYSESVWIERGEDALNEFIEELKSEEYYNYIVEANCYGSTEFYIEIVNCDRPYMYNQYNLYSSDTGMITLGIQPQKIYQ